MWVERTQKGNFKFVEGYKDPNTGKTKRVSVTYEKNTSAIRKQALKELSSRITKAVNNGSHTTYNEAIDVYLKSIDIKPTTLKLKRNTLKFWRNILMVEICISIKSLVHISGIFI